MRHPTTSLLPRLLALGLALSLVPLAASRAAEAAAPPAEEARALLAVDVLTGMQSLTETRMPEALLKRAQGIAIIPKMARGALLIGGRGGKGVATMAGAFVVLAPLASCIAITIFTAVVLMTRLVSLGSVAAAAATARTIFGWAWPRSMGPQEPM